jgi:hypothetical protein
MERWTRQLLETEARKRGLRDAAAHSQAELVRAILRHDLSLPRGLQNARKLMGSLWQGASAWLLRGRSSHVGFCAPAPRETQGAAPSAAPENPAAVGDEAARDAWLEPSRLRPRELHLRWQVSERASQRASGLLGVPGELAVRVVSVCADPERVLHSQITDHGPIEPAGEWSMQLESDATHCVSSIGMRSGSRFVSIVHGRSNALDTTLE